MRALVSLVVVLLLPVPAAAGCGEDERPSSESRPVATATAQTALLDALRAGGLVLALRHSTTEPKTDARESLRSCAQQRNLTEAGRRQARAIGAGVRALRVPVGEVRTSPFCRTRDTARLAFGAATEDDRLVSLGTLGTVEDDDRRVRALQRMLGTRPAAGENRVLVTHTPNLGEAAGISLAEGETAVFRPLGGRRFELVGRIPADDWAALS